MRILFAFFVLSITGLFSQFGLKENTEERKLVVGYYPFYNKIFYSHTDIKYKNLTHICHAFIKPDSSGNLIVDDNFIYPELIDEAHKSKVKVLVSVGGWGGDGGFNNVASDDVARNNFIKNLTDFCLKHNYDGADIDWEYPRKDDRENFVSLIKDLRNAFNEAGIKFLSAALPSRDFRNGYAVEELNNYLDWFGIMTYDFHGSWSNHSGHNSPLSSSPLDTCGSINQSVKYYLSKGMQKEKMLIGIPFYGREFNSPALYLKNDGGSSSLFPNSNSKLIAESWKYEWDAVCSVPVIYNDTHSKIISFEDVNSIQAKSRYLLNNNLGGIIIWALGQDFDGNHTPLLDAVGSNIFKPPTQNPSTPVLISALKEEDTFKLKWYPAKNAWEYNLEIASDSLFSFLIGRENNIQSTSYLLKKSIDGEFFWRVRAKNFLGYSDWSEISKSKND